MRLIDADAVLDNIDAEAWEYTNYINEHIGGNMDIHINMFADNIRERVNELPSVNPQEPKTGQFAKLVASEIFDEMWEYNKDAFAEIACRKLAKLGIVRAKDDEWELVEPQERSE